MDKTAQTNQQPWLNTPVSDLVFILSPPFVSLLLVLLFPAQFKVTNAMPLQYWLMLVVFVDVAHVYSTLYRTYFNPSAIQKKYLLTLIPLGCYIVGVILYQLDSLWFWRILAYLAVFHFIRQQYGFMRLYSRKETTSKTVKIIDKITIYTATLYPILYWHVKGDRNFNWFINGDFYYFSSPWLLKCSSWIYLLVITVYLLKEMIELLKGRAFNLPRNLLVLGTFLSWYFGIVYFNGDMAFTTLNVISHGIPYMALIWFFEKKRYHQQPKQRNKVLKLSFGHYGVLLFILIIVGLAYIEEGLWDGFVWREHERAFALFAQLPVIENTTLLAFLVPLLSLPQSTHYVLDGFIWKRSVSKK